MEPGELRRIARTISTVENQAEGYEDVLAEAYRRQSSAQVIGITGPPGSGKSTLVDALTAHWAQAGERIAVLAIDPSSPYSGGAVLGDRIRRSRSVGYDNTYFRSLSSRGHVGGLTDTATDLIAVLSLFEFGRVVIETVGAGQADIEIHETADCTLVMTVPGLGDGVQASKAGLMEIGDVFAVNKADLPGADDAAGMIERALAVAYMGEPGVNQRHATTTATPAALASEASGQRGHSMSARAGHSPEPGSSARAPYPATAGMAALRRRHGDVAVDDSTWVPPVLKLTATENQGVTELAQAVDTFIAWSDHTGRRHARRRERAYAQVMRALAGLLLAPYRREPGAEALPAMLAPWIDRIADGSASPLEVARALLGGAAR
jgi:LAO/AO transport system kinase